MEYITTGNIALLILVIYSILKLVAPSTKTGLDDKIVTGIDTGLAWLKSNMPDAYAKVEKAATGGTLTGGAAKLAIYLWELNMNHIADHGVPMPVEMIETAARKAEGMAAKSTLDKASGEAAVDAILKASGAPAANPIPAPLSK